MQRDPLQEHLFESIRSVKRSLLSFLRRLFSFASVKFLLVAGVVGLFAITFFTMGVWGDTRVGMPLLRSLSSQPDNLQNGLVGHWTFDVERMSSNVMDSSGNGLTGFLAGFAATTTVGGPLGHGLKFDGTDDWAYVNDSASLDFDSGETITVAAWVKPEGALEYSELVIKGRKDESTTANYSLRQTDEGKIQFYYRDRDSLAWQIWTSTRSHVVLSHWTHVMVTYTFGTGSSLKLYVNGVEEGGSWTTNSGNVAPVQNNEALVFASKQFDAGGGDPDTYFEGSLDDVRIYSRALSISEAEQLYDLGAMTRVNVTLGTQATSPESLANGLMGHWTFDGKDMVPNVRDISGNDNHGTVSGFTSTTTAAGRIGQALEFDGSDDQVGLGTSSAIRTSSVTASAWVKADLNDSGFVLQTGLSPYGFNIFVNADGTARIELDTADNAAANRSGVTNIEGDWHHIVITYNETDGTNYLYVDGVDELGGVAIAGLSGALSYNAAYETLIGRRNDGNHALGGVIDDVRIYNRPLSAEEVARLYELGATTHINVTLGNNKGASSDSLGEGLVAHYTFDGKNMYQNAEDVSGSGNTGYLTGFTSTTTVIGKLGQALEFDGTDDYVDGGADDSLEPSLPLSVSFWFNLNSHVDVGASPLIYHRSATTNQYDGYWIAVTTAGALNINYGSDTFTCHSGSRRTKETASATIALGTWYHVVGVMRGPTDMDIYINGSNAGGSYSGTGDSLVYEPTSFLSIGRGGQGSTCALQYADAIFDDVRIYNRALTAEEVGRLYNLGH